MVSGSGDGTLKVWNFLKGKVVSSVICAQDAKLEELDIDDPTNKEQHQFKRTTSWPSILGMYIVLKPNCFKKQRFFHHFYLTEVIIQVQNGHGVFDRLFHGNNLLSTPCLF